MKLANGKRIIASALTYLGILTVTLLALDLTCIAFGLFPPTHDYGDADLGWRPARATGAPTLDRCTEYSTGEVVQYQRNEDGVRTEWSRDRLASDSTKVKIGVTGDSQTDLCAPNAQLHSGVLESELRSEGVSAVVLPYGSGRYSPLQDYLAFRKVLEPYHPQVLVMNLYTGNDFYDILRADDRPHFALSDSGYRIVEPVWYTLDNPQVHHTSRVLFAARTFADKIGVRHLYFRLSELRRLGAEQGAGFPAVLSYMNALWRVREPTVGYSDAFAAQILNQQLFFHYFPSSQEESVRRVEALMKLIRREYPELILVMSPLPSYELVEEQPVDSALLRTLARLPITKAAGIQQEGGLYQRLRELSAEQGWGFVDNLAALKAYRGPERLYNNFDYHLLPVASVLVGKAQATTILETLRKRVP